MRFRDMRFDIIWLDARLATLAPGRPGLGVVERGVVAAKDGRIVFAGPMAELPTGTVTFLMTDIEGSTRLWEQFPQAMQAALARHATLAAEILERHGGTLVKHRGEGDSLFAVFARASQALAAACALQQAFVNFGFGTGSYPQISQIDADWIDSFSIHLRQSAKSAD